MMKSGDHVEFVLPENIAPYKVQIIPKVENEEKMKFANSVYSN